MVDHLHDDTINGLDDNYAEANLHRDNGCADHLIMAVDETYNGLAR